jgi:hypothetical protein
VSSFLIAAITQTGLTATSKSLPNETWKTPPENYLRNDPGNRNDMS